jgi:hypothetical protein
VPNSNPQKDPNCLNRGYQETWSTTKKSTCQKGKPVTLDHFNVLVDFYDLICCMAFLGKLTISPSIESFRLFFNGEEKYSPDKNDKLS